MASAATVVRFDLDDYQVLPDETFQAQVHLDADDAVPGLQPLPAELFSYGFKLTLDDSRAVIDAVTPPIVLDFLGFVSGAEISIAAGEATIKRSVDANSLANYAGTLLATIT
jgi:hypothetical protein